MRLDWSLSACARLHAGEEPDETPGRDAEPRRLRRRGFVALHRQRDERQHGVRLNERAIRCVERRGPRARATVVFGAGIAGRLIAVHGGVLNKYPHIMSDAVSLGDQTHPIES